MDPPFSLAYLTYAPLPLPEAIVLAARLGYHAVGARVAPALPNGDYTPLIEDRALLREARARVAETGVGIGDVEIIRLGPAFRVADVAPFLEIAGTLGARAVLVAGDDPDEARLTASFAAFCVAAARHGLTADLEFMPWTRVPHARAALRIVTGAGQPNGRVLVDTLHAARSATTLADLAAIPRDLLGYAQLCDAPGEMPTTAEGLIHTARCARLLPGEGGLDLVGILSQLPPGLPISLEIPNDARLAAVGPDAWAHDALATARALVRRCWSPQGGR